MTGDDFEGRLLAHRRVLQLIVNGLSRPAGERVRAQLRDRATLQDGQEDPGAVETDGMGVELAVAEEFRRIAEGVPGIAAEAGEAPPGGGPDG